MIAATAVVHQTAEIDPTVDIGEYAVIGARVKIGAFTRIWHHVNIVADTEIGQWCSIGKGTEIGRECRIGNRTRISALCFLPNHSIIGENVFLGPGVICTDDRKPKVPNPSDPPYAAQPPQIDDFASLGARVVLLPGVRVHHHGRVGAGALVARDVIPHQLVYGERAHVRNRSADAQEW